MRFYDKIYKSIVHLKISKHFDNPPQAGGLDNISLMYVCRCAVTFKGNFM